MQSEVWSQCIPSQTGQTPTSVNPPSYDQVVARAPATSLNTSTFGPQLPPALTPGPAHTIQQTPAESVDVPLSPELSLFGNNDITDDEEELPKLSLAYGNNDIPYDEELDTYDDDTTDVGYCVDGSDNRSDFGFHFNGSDYHNDVVDDNTSRHYFDNDNGIPDGNEGEGEGGSGCSGDAAAENESYEHEDDCYRNKCDDTDYDADGNDCHDTNGTDELYSGDEDADGQDFTRDKSDDKEGTDNQNMPTVPVYKLHVHDTNLSFTRTESGVRLSQSNTQPSRSNSESSESTDSDLSMIDLMLSLMSSESSTCSSIISCSSESSGTNSEPPPTASSGGLAPVGDEAQHFDLQAYFKRRKRERQENRQAKEREQN